MAGGSILFLKEQIKDNNNPISVRSRIPLPNVRVEDGECVKGVHGGCDVLQVSALSILRLNICS